MVWNVDPEIFRIGPLALRWYGLFFAAGFLIGYLLLRQLFIWENRRESDLSTLFSYVFWGTLIGARLGHVLFYQPFDYFFRPWEVLMIWQGGLASHGGFAGVMIALYFYSRKHQDLKFLELADRVAIASLPAASLIRIGNFFNSEILGVPTAMPWGVVFAQIDNVPRHAVMLYESLGYAVLFLLAFVAYRKTKQKHFRGRLLGCVLVVAFFMRLILESFKQDQSVFDRYLLLNVGQVLSLLFVLFGIALLFYRTRESRCT